MEPNSNITLEKMIEILQKTFTRGTHVKEAEQILNELAKEPTKFVDSLIGVMVADINLPASINIKDAACLQLRNTLQKHLNDETLLDDQKIYIINAILQCLFIETVTFTQQELLKSILEDILMSNDNFSIKNSALVLIRDKLATKDVKVFSPSLNIYQAIITASHNKPREVANYYQGVSTAILEAGATLVQGITSEIQNITPENKEQVLSNINYGLRVLSVWLSSMFTTIKYLSGENLKAKHSSYIQVIIMNQDIVDILARILIIHLPTEKQLKGCVFSTTGIPAFDKPLNTAKSIVIKIFNRIIDFVNRTFKVLNPNLNKIYTFIKTEGIQGILQSVFILCKTEGFDLEAAVEDVDLHENLVECLAFLSKLCLENQFYNIFSDYKKQLIVDVILPLMRATESELESFRITPDEFVYLAEDCVDSQKSGTAKTQAAEFLENLCDHIDGALTFFTVAAVNLIDYSLISDSPEEIPTKFPVLTEHTKSVIVVSTPAHIRVETCLLALTVMCYKIVKRSDLLNMVEKLLEVYHGFFLGDKTDAIIKARICILFEYYSEFIFNGPNQGELFKYYLAFLITALGIENEDQQSLAQQAGNALSELFSDEDYHQKMNEYIPDILEKLCQYIDGLKSYTLFDIILDILKAHSAFLAENSNLFLNLCRLLANRAVGEYELVRTKQKKGKMYIHKIWNIFLAIGERRELVTKYLSDIEKILTPFFSYLEQDPDVPFGDDILKFMGSVLRITQEVSAVQWDIFKLFPKIFEKHGGLIEAMFVPLNLIIIYGSNVINQDPASITFLIDMAIKALNPNNDRADEANCADGALMLQLIIQYLGPIQDEDWKKILIATNIKYADAQNSFLKARLVGIYLCAFLTDFKRTQAFLKQYADLDTVMKAILGDLMIYKHHSYDRKLLVITLSHMFLQTDVDEAIHSRFPALLDACVTILTFTKYLEQRDTKKKNEDGTASLSDNDILYNLIHNNNINKPVTRNIDDEEYADVSDDDYVESDDDEDDDDLDMPGDAATQASLRLDIFQTQLKKQDEFAFFRNVIATIKNSNHEALAAMHNMLSQTKQEHFKQVILSQRVLTSEGKATARKVVKTKARKTAENYSLANQGGNEQQNQ